MSCSKVATTVRRESEARHVVRPRMEKESERERDGRTRVYEGRVFIGRKKKWGRGKGRKGMCVASVQARL